MTKFLKYFCAIILFTISVTALICGIILIFKPAGQILGLNVNLLQYSPFKDFFIPGIFLFIFIGVFNLSALLLIILRSHFYIHAILIQGIVLCTWLTIQVWLIRTVHPLHIILFFLGLLLTVSGIILDKKSQL